MAGLSNKEEKAMITMYRYLKRESGSEGVELYRVAHRSNRMILVKETSGWVSGKPYFLQLILPHYGMEFQGSKE